MNYKKARHERRNLKQQLFKIRLFIEGSAKQKELGEDLEELKEKYEALDGFTNWHDFPDKWDIGDPHEVKKGAFTFTDVDKRNFRRIAGKPYETIVHLEHKAGVHYGEESVMKASKDVVKQLLKPIED